MNPVIKAKLQLVGVAAALILLQGITTADTLGWLPQIMPPQAALIVDAAITGYGTLAVRRLQDVEHHLEQEADVTPPTEPAK